MLVQNVRKHVKWEVLKFCIIVMKTIQHLSLSKYVFVRILKKLTKIVYKNLILLYSYQLRANRFKIREENILEPPKPKRLICVLQWGVIKPLVLGGKIEFYEEIDFLCRIFTNFNVKLPICSLGRLSKWFSRLDVYWIQTNKQTNRQSR